MCTTTQMIERFKALNVAIEARKSIAKVAPEIVEMNRDQLFHGFASDGNHIGWYRNPFQGWYSQMKHDKNPLPGLGRPDLFLTGTFYESMEVDVGGDQVEYLADDPNGLEEKYGKEIFGLTDENRYTFIYDKLQPEFVNSVKQIVKL